MNLRPKASLTEQEVQTGLKLVIGDGLAAEAMTTLTGGAFLVAMALLLGASNFQIGLLAGMPTFTNLFQLLSIWLVRRYNNRRAIAVLCALLARIPLLVVGLLVWTLGFNTSVAAVIFFLFFYYFFGSVAGPSWNSWIKDLVPERSMGAYFSRRGSYTQTLNVVLSFTAALLVDYVKKHYPAYELTTYAILFMGGGAMGIAGGFILAVAPEPASFLDRENMFRLLSRPLRNKNFRQLLIFNSAWVFALNIATPFFTVFMMKGLGLSLSYIIGLTILSQLSSILTIRIWGIFADRYSNKTIIAISAPFYITCIVAWCFVGIYSQLYANLILLAAIHIVTGISTAGVNLSLTNIGLKLAPREDAIVYLSANNIITAFFSSIAPLIGGVLADIFTQRHLVIDATWTSPRVHRTLHLVALHDWNFLFLLGAILALIALDLLGWVRETGEVKKDVVVRIMRSSIKNNLKDAFIIGHLITWRSQFLDMLRKKSAERE
ncbi:MFS transporter [Chitinophaga agrisoli]|uniref:MFS transporter n=1 Tax=Chitinophaga agrisoli TaxID=2607653 RepID=A0A5B2VV45_9BACT|nr:MFS transporter [Chitinophaga agrisoli]KAA2242935.1 MFS transporter [Chitinophaga agrisoli]